MNDILGRKVRRGDLVISIDRLPNGKPTVQLAVWSGQTARLVDRTLDRSNVYLIENPTEQEMLFRDRVFRRYTTMKNAKDRYNERNADCIWDVIRGGVYRDANDQLWLCLGMVEKCVEVYDEEDVENTITYVDRRRGRGFLLVDERVFELGDREFDESDIEGEMRLLVVERKKFLKENVATVKTKDIYEFMGDYVYEGWATRTRVVNIGSGARVGAFGKPLEALGWESDEPGEKTREGNELL